MFRDRDKWRVSWRVDGQKLSRVFETKGEAELFEVKLRNGEIAREQIEQYTFADWAERWLETYSKTRKHESQWGKDRLLIERFLVPAFGSKWVSSLRRGDLLQLMTRLRVELSPKTKRPLAPKSVNNIAALAKKIMSDAVQHDLVSQNPFVGVQMLRVTQKPMAFWTIDERERFIAGVRVLDPAFTEAVVVACHTGLRLGELTALQRRDLDFQRGKILVRASYNHELGKRFENTKGREIAEVPMNQAVREVLQSRATLPSEAAVFPRVLLSSACHRLQKLCVAAGVTPLRFHDLRHTFASTLAMAGVDLMQIQRLMRHKSYQMTLRYAHLHPDHLRGVTEVLCSGVPQMSRTIHLVGKSGGPTRT